MKLYNKWSFDLTELDALSRLSKEKTHGDYSTNMAMQLARVAKKAPRVIAEALIENFDRSKASIEKMITLGKRGDLHARRQAASYVRNEVADAEKGQDALQKLFTDIAPRYTERQGGYTRIMKLGPRRGDGAPMVIIELV
jgi:ribosomal protein L17